MTSSRRSSAPSAPRSRARGPRTARSGRSGSASPGEIDVEAGAVLLAANVPGFSERVELGPIVSELVDGVEVKVGNDVSVGVLGEFSRGAGRPFRNLLGVWVGTGVGGGLILDGVLHDGRGAGGEVGHMVVEPGGLRCPCGRRGCLEAYAGGSRWSGGRRKLVKQGRKTELFSIMKKQGRTSLSSGVYARALKRGDKLTKKLIDDAVWALGVGLASAQNLLDLEAIVIGGGLGDRLGQPFVDRIVEAMTAAPVRARRRRCSAPSSATSRAPSARRSSRAASRPS